MKKQLMFTLFLVLGAAMLTSISVAQNLQAPDRQYARVEYATFDPNQGGLLRQTDWDDHRRCDGDHDRDDRGCWNGQTYYRGNGYYANPYDGNGYYARNSGWYDRKGNFYPYGANGYFDKHGKWHYVHGRKRGWDDR